MNDEIVISGISGRYPESWNSDQFWNNLLSGKELYKESTPRWPVGNMSTPPTLGMIPGIEKFDSDFFGIPSSIANEMDPQFRISHEVTYEALLDAGLDPVDMRGDTRTGCFIAYCENPTTNAKGPVGVSHDNLDIVVDEYSSFFKLLGIKGPTSSYDSACASSFSALNEAFHAIKCNLIDTAIVCGQTIHLRPRIANYFRRMGMTNPDGRSFCLDQRAKGYVRAETVSTIILQRKSVAKRCYAIVANVKSNADGYKVEGITFPGLKTQIKLMKETYEEVNLDPKDVQYIEAHVTSTQAGDVVECGAIEAVFCPDDRKNPVLVGCLKSNMGHAEGASGTAALTKACLIMQNKMIPANINYESANDQIEGIKNGKLKPVTELTMFDAGTISVDSFGFGGCNIHTILKSYDREEEQDGNNNNCNDDVHHLSGFNDINRLILFKARNESSFKHLKRMIERQPDQITTEFLALVSNVAFLKDGQLDGHGSKFGIRGYFMLDGHDKTIIECDWKCVDTDMKDPKAIDQDNVMNQLATIKSCGQSNLFLNNTFLTKLGKCYMNSPGVEQLIDMDMMYPKVMYPVSRTTASISPLIEWHHGQDCTVYSLPLYHQVSAAYRTTILEYGSVHSHLRGHVIDGRIIVPATQYLQSVWHAIAMEKVYFGNDVFLKTGIKFWNVNFHSAIMVNDRNEDVTIQVHANTVTGSFEVVHDGSVAVSGHAALTNSYDVPCGPNQDHVNRDDGHEVLKKEDFYKELRVRGYDYEGKFQGVEECKIDGTGGQVSFLDNWVCFADAVLQVSLIADPSRSLIVPTGIEFLQIDPSKFRHIPTLEKEMLVDVEKSLAFQDSGHDEDGHGHEELLFEGGFNYKVGDDSKSESPFNGADGKKKEDEKYVPEIFDVQIKKETKEIFTNCGLYIRSLSGTPIVRKKVVPTIQKYSFQPFDEYYQEHPINSKMNEMYQEECLKIMSSLNSGKQSVIDGQFMDGSCHPLVHKLNEYREVIEGHQDKNVAPPSIAEYLTMNQNSECDLSKDPLLNTPIDKDICTIQQFNLIGESAFMSKNLIIEMNGSSKCSIRNDLNNMTFAMGPINTYVYVDEDIIRQKLKHVDGDNQGIESYLKGLLTSSCKLVAFQHPSLGFSFLDTTIVMNDRLRAFKEGLRVVHDHAHNGTFAMVIFRTEQLDIESSILSSSKMVANEDSIFVQVDDMKKFITSVGWAIISTKVVGVHVSILARKVDIDSLNKAIKVEIDNFSYDWVDGLKENIYKPIVDGDDDIERKAINDGPIYIISRGSGLTGINGFIRCVNREDKRFRGIHIETQDGSTLDTYQSVLNMALKYGLLCTYYRNGIFGSYICDENLEQNEHENEGNVEMNVKHEANDDETNESFVTTNCLDVATKGDLSSLQYYKIKLPINDNNGTRIVDVHYAALNFKDVMVASGRVPLTAYPEDMAFKKTPSGDLGMEFSGIDTSNGKRIMGLNTSDAIAEKILIGKSSDIVFDVPNHMSLEEAATIPVVYSTVYYALIMRGKLLPGESILIHAGSGGVGQAAINVCQSMGCEIFTTVGTDEKRQFIKSQFNIPDDHIFNSRSTSFADDLLRATDGRGVDMVLNSLSDEKLQAGLTCLADSGRFIEIGKYDMVSNSPFDPSLLTKNQSFQSVCLAFFMQKMVKYSGSGTSPDKHRLRQLMDKGLKDGIVKPLQRTIFGMNQAEEAFRFMATGKHIGKVLMDMNQSGTSSCSIGDRVDKTVTTKNGTPGTMDAKPRVTFDGNKSYVVIGGLGGMGLEVCHWMVTKGVRNLIITSRSGIKAKYQKYCIDRMKNDYNCNVQISNLDIANFQEAEDLLKFCDSFGPLGGIFHIAMVLSEDQFQNQSTESFGKCCPVKIHGGHNLDQITRKLYPKLDHFVVFSSIASTFGNVGQCNYGLANNFLDDLCTKRRVDGYNALSIAWGLVGDVGWVADNMVGVTNLAGATIQRINSCLEVMERILYGNNPNMVCFVHNDGKAKVGASTNLAEAVFNILGIKDPSKLDPKTTLGELGLDSLMATEMRQILEKETGISYSAKEIRATTVAEVEDFSANK